MKNVIQTSVKLATLFLGLTGAILPFHSFAEEQPIPASSNPQGSMFLFGENVPPSSVSSVPNDKKDPLTAGPLSAATPEEGVKILLSVAQLPPDAKRLTTPETEPKIVSPSFSSVEVKRPPIDLSSLTVPSLNTGEQTEVSVTPPPDLQPIVLAENNSSKPEFAGQGGAVIELTVVKSQAEPKPEQEASRATEDQAAREALRASLFADTEKKSAAATKEIERLGIVLRGETKKVNDRIASADRGMKEVAGSLVRRSQELTQIQSQPAVADSTQTAIQKFNDSVQALIKSLPEKNRKFYQALRASAQRQTSSDIESNKIYRKALTVYEEKVKKASSTDELKSLAGQIPVFKKRTMRLVDPLSLNPRPAFTAASQEGERLRLRVRGEIDKFQKARTALLDRNTNEIRATQEALDKLQAELKKAESEAAARIHSIDGEFLQLGGSLTSLLEALKKVQKKAGTADAAKEAIQKFNDSAKALLNSLPKRREQFNEAQRVSSLAQLFSDRRNSRKYLSNLEAYQKKVVVVQNIGQIEKLAKEFPVLKKETVKPRDPKPLDPRPVLVKTIEEGNRILSQAQRRG